MSFKILRKKIGSQDEFAKLVGVDRTTVGKWESGLSYPRRPTLRKIAEVTGESEGEILEAIDNSMEKNYEN